MNQSVIECVGAVYWQGLLNVLSSPYQRAEQPLPDR